MENIVSKKVYKKTLCYWDRRLNKENDIDEAIRNRIVV